MAASVPFFVRGAILLPETRVPTGSLAALLPALVAANFCILELPPYRFLHLVTGLVLFGAFFIVGPAILALFALAAVTGVVVGWLLRCVGWLEWQPLGSAPAEFAVPAAALAVTVGTVDAFGGLAYPFRPVGTEEEAKLIVLQLVLYTSFIVLNEIGIWLRFGVRRAYGTPHARSDLMTYALVIFPSGPILSGITGAYGPQVADMLFVFWYLLIGFGTFAVLRMLVGRRLEVERLLAVIGRQERLAAIGGLASVIAHQTRHHLGILGMSSYVLGQKLAGEPLSPATRAAVGHELDAMARTRAELDHLLTAGMRADGSTVEFHALALMRECGAHLGPLAEGRGVAITYAGGDVAIRGDRVHLKQALTNLIRNAIEAAPRGGSVTVGLTADATDVRLTVRDGGSGLSPRARVHLFEPLFTEKSGGLGMGLYVTRAIVEAHGGSLTLTSTGEGTEAEIRLARSASQRGL